MAQAPAADLERALAELNSALRTHGGSVECVSVSGDLIRLRMVGLCAGCLYRPLTLAATIRPFIAERLGMRVEIDGARISAEAQARVERALIGSYPPPPAPDDRRDP